jgi:hypothetical protein
VIMWTMTQLNAAISALTGVRTNSRGPISAAGRARIAAAQRARWAKVIRREGCRYRQAEAKDVSGCNRQDTGGTKSEVGELEKTTKEHVSFVSESIAD